MENKWSKEKIWKWYNSRPWIRGCNYMSADCANRIDQWQEYGFEERFKTTEEEFKLLKETGFNSIRIIIEFLVWKEEHDSFLKRFDRYLDLCEKYGITCMVVLANDCMRPKGLEISTLGEQKYDLGYHGGRKLSQHGNLGGMGHHYLDEEENRSLYLKMIEEIVTRYKDDKRIIIWNVYNEVGNSKRTDVTLPNLKEIFSIIRKINPSQPLTAETWTLGKKEINELPEVEQFALENSDITSFHSYDDYVTNVKLIKTLKELGRPLINSEWLARCLDNSVFELFPLFYLEKIGCYNWGFVAGKYQTYEPWNSVWERYEKDPNIKWDFTKWFHDLYRPNHRPYDPKEIELIKYFTSLADEDFKNK